MWIHLTFLSAHLSCLKTATNHHFLQLRNVSAREFPIAMVTGTLFQCLFIFSIVFVYRIYFIVSRGFFSSFRAAYNRGRCLRENILARWKKIKMSSLF